jgi:hypothetical protein
VIPITGSVTNRVTTGAGGLSYNTTLPSPYNTLPVNDIVNSSIASPSETSYYMYYYVGNPIVSAIASSAVATDAAMLDYIGSITPASKVIKWVINKSGSLIKGSF